MRTRSTAGVGIGSAVVLAGICCLTGCGSIGEPLYPALNIPSKITDLTVVERGDRIDITFTIPPLTTEGLPLKEIGGIDLRAGPNNQTTFNMNQWVASSTSIQIPTPGTPGPVHAEIPAQQFIGKDVIVAVRVMNARNRVSDWSTMIVVPVEQPLAKPSELKAESAPRGVWLTWTASSGNQFRIYRKNGQEQKPSLLATATEPSYLDATAEFSKNYQYYVESVHDKTESDVAGPVEITPKDTFPPEVPKGLTVSAGVGAIELAWQRNTEADFKEYQVLRSEGAGEFAKIASGLLGPSYSDRKIETGKHYRYRVLAIDQSGNASEPSAPVEASAP